MDSKEEKVEKRKEKKYTPIMDIRVGFKPRAARYRAGRACWPHSRYKTTRHVDHVDCEIWTICHARFSILFTRNGIAGDSRIFGSALNWRIVARDNIICCFVLIKYNVQTDNERRKTFSGVTTRCFNGRVSSPAVKRSLKICSISCP